MTMRDSGPNESSRDQRQDKWPDAESSELRHRTVESSRDFGVNGVARDSGLDNSMRDAGLTESVRDLLTKAHQDLRSAEILTGMDGVDSAASRLGYAMFYAAQAALANQGLAPKSKREVLAHFGRMVETEELGPELQRWLLDGFDRMEQDDNSARNALNQDDIRELRLNAADFVERVELWLREHNATCDTSRDFPL